MSSLHVCLLCRRNLSRNRTLQVLQWRPRATFISLSENPKGTTEGESRQELLGLGIVNDRSGKRYIDTTSIRQRRKQAPRRPSSVNDGDLLEALFEESLQQPSSEATELKTPMTSLEPYMRAVNLRRMLAEPDCSIVEAWKLFKEHFGPDAWRTGKIKEQTLHKHFFSAKNLLTKKLIAAKRKNPFSSALPSVREFSKVYSQLGWLGPQDWAEAMYDLLEALIKLDKASPRNPEHIQSTISDIIGAWNVVCRQAGRLQDESSEFDNTYDWSRLPTISFRHTSASYQKRGINGLFAQFIPTFPPPFVRHVAVIAAATFALLTKESIADESIVFNATPLINILSIPFAVSGFDAGSLADMPNLPSSISGFLRETNLETKRTASDMQVVNLQSDSLSESRSSKFQSTPERSLHPSIRTDVASITKRLYDAWQRRDTPQVNKLWSDVQHLPVEREPAGAIVDGMAVEESIRGKLTADLCNYFIMIYMALHKPSQAIDVWNHMARNGLPPSLKTWDSMMNGCKASKDAKALEDIWLRMLQLGVEPDVVCWTTRIGGLIACNQADKAIFALDEMGRDWVSANEQTRNNSQTNKSKQKGPKNVMIVKPTRPALKPTIEVVNAAVSGLLRKHKTEMAYRVLAWAAKFNIQPDVITYNTLLAPLIRDGNTKQAMALLKQMQAAGVKADVATFTTIIEETFRYSNELTSQEQMSMVDSIFSEMEAAGVKTNSQTYGRMIYELLQGASGDLVVVNIVMEHMMARGIQPSTHIYTMLLTHYFNQEPADLDAVRRLIDSTELEIGSVDHIFWDRVIEGYARANDTTAAMRILGKLESRGGHISWVTRQVLVTSLVQNDEWAIAKSLVNNIKDEVGLPRPDSDMKGKEGQQRFWRLAAELELL